MKLFTALILLFTTLSLFAESAEQVKSESIKRTIYYVIEDSEMETTYEDMGKIWLTPYISEYESDREDWSFDILKKRDNNNDGKVDWMKINASYTCGSEYDSSKFLGSCTVIAYTHALKNWYIKLDGVCTCGD